MQTRPVLSADCGEQVFDLALHPSRPLVAAGTIDGQVLCFDYGKAAQSPSTTRPSVLFDLQLHQHSCRSVDFGLDGSSLFSVSKDKSIKMVDVDTGKLMLRKNDAHKNPINIVKSITETLLATGDDMGIVKIWDTRQRRVVRKYHDHTDFIADMYFEADKQTLLCAGGDGCLSVVDIRKAKSVDVSDNQDDELLSVCSVRDSTKAIVGTQSGTLLIFNWNDWGDCTDRFPGHPMSISSIVKSPQDPTATLYTGSSDGIIRAIQLFPHRLVGPVADTGDTMPVEKMGMSFDGEFLVTCAHDTMVKFWRPEVDVGKGKDVDDDDEDSDEDDDDDDDEVDDDDVQAKTVQVNADSDDDDDDDQYEDIEDDEDDDDDKEDIQDQDSDDEPPQNPKSPPSSLPQPAPKSIPPTNNPRAIKRVHSDAPLPTSSTTATTTTKDTGDWDATNSSKKSQKKRRASARADVIRDRAMRSDFFADL